MAEGMRDPGGTVEDTNVENNESAEQGVTGIRIRIPKRNRFDTFAPGVAVIFCVTFTAPRLLIWYVRLSLADTSGRS